MLLTPIEIVIIILSVALGTLATRITPFILFPEMKKPPEIITYLGKVLPPAMMGLLVIYCFKDIKIGEASYGIPEIIAVLVIFFIHKWKSNVLLSIGSGTAVYMVLVQAVF